MKKQFSSKRQRKTIKRRKHKGGERVCVRRPGSLVRNCREINNGQKNNNARVSFAPMTVRRNRK